MGMLLCVCVCAYSAWSLLKPIQTHDPDQNWQGRVKCRPHVTIPVVLTQEAIPEEDG